MFIHVRGQYHRPHEPYLSVCILWSVRCHNQPERDIRISDPESFHKIRSFTKYSHAFLFFCVVRFRFVWCSAFGGPRIELSCCCFCFSHLSTAYHSKFTFIYIRSVLYSFLSFVVLMFSNLSSAGVAKVSTGETCQNLCLPMHTDTHTQCFGRTQSSIILVFFFSHFPHDNRTGHATTTSSFVYNYFENGCLMFRGWFKWVAWPNVWHILFAHNFWQFVIEGKLAAPV